MLKHLILIMFFSPRMMFKFGYTFYMTEERPITWKTLNTNGFKCTERQTKSAIRGILLNAFLQALFLLTYKWSDMRVHTVHTTSPTRFCEL